METIEWAGGKVSEKEREREREREKVGVAGRRTIFDFARSWWAQPSVWLSNSFTVSCACMPNKRPPPNQHPSLLMITNLEKFLKSLRFSGERCKIAVKMTNFLISIALGALIRQNLVIVFCFLYRSFTKLAYPSDYHFPLKIHPTPFRQHPLFLSSW